MIFKPNVKKLKLKGDVEKLITLTEPKIDDEIRKQAFEALGEIKNPQALQSLIEAVEDEKDEIRNTINLAMKNIIEDSHGKISTDELIKFATNKLNVSVRIAAYIALSENQDSQATNHLIECLEDDNILVEKEVNDILSRRDQDSLCAIIDRLIKENEYGKIEELIKLDVPLKTEVVSKLLKDGSSFCYAVRNGCLEIVKIFLNGGADPNKKGKYVSFSDEELPPIYVLARPWGSGVDENAISLERRVSRNRKEIAQTLIDAGADPALKIPKVHGWKLCPLYDAVSLRSSVGFNFFRKLGFSLHDSRDDIIAMAQMGYSFKDHGSADDRNNYVEHIKLITQGQMDFIEILLKNGGDLNELSEDHASALYYAISEGSLAMVEFLLSHGADPNLKFREDTPIATLLGAPRALDTEILKVLIQYGADLTICDGQEFNALELAKIYKRTKLIQLIEESMK